jgi:MoaA/NifB/PqqE/SkfB family radical SAM enzyme
MAIGDLKNIQQAFDNKHGFFTKFKQTFLKSVLFFYIRMSAKIRLKLRKHLRFETDIVGHCNLNCKCCNHFSPLVEKYFVETEVFEKDFSRLSELAGRKNENIDIMGGGPLLHPEISKILEIARKYFDGPINIVTNGTLLKKMSTDFWEACKRNNINIKVTSYPIKLDHREIKRLAIKYSVKVYIRMQFMNKHVWCRLPKDMEGRQNIIDNINLCLVANFCIFLREGKLSTCCLPLLIDWFNAYFSKNIEVSENDFIDIYKAKSIEEIYNFLSKPMPFCRYCKIREWEVGINWDVSQKEISEWFD